MPAHDNLYIQNIKNSIYYQAPVKSIENDSANLNPNDGDRFLIVNLNALNAFTGKENNIAIYNANTNSYSFVAPQELMVCKNLANGQEYIYKSNQWSLNVDDDSMYMRKDVYDINDNGIVDVSSSLSDGTITLTPLQIKSSMDKSHEHSNKLLLDTYNQSNNDLSDAVIKKHSHSNLAVLGQLSEDSSHNLLYNGAIVGDKQILFYTTVNDFPIIGEVDKIYVDLTTNKFYRWDLATNSYVDLIDNVTEIYILETEADRIALVNPIPNKFYYVKESNKFYFYNGSNYILINNASNITPKNITITSATIDRVATNLTIQFIVPEDNVKLIRKIDMFISYTQDLSPFEYQYMIDNNITLYKDDFPIESLSTVTFYFPITSGNIGKTLYSKFFVEYISSNLVVSSGAVLNIILKDDVPNDPITNFIATQNINNIILNWVNPTGVDNIDFSYVFIIENENRIPINKTDGTKVYEGNGNSITLSNKDKSKHYYYRAFVVDYSGNIQDNISQICDIQMDNNAPAEVTDYFIASTVTMCKLKWTDSASSDWIETRIIRKTSSEPISINDGTLVLSLNTKDIYKSQYYTDRNLSNFTYYYKIYGIDINQNINNGITLIGNPEPMSILDVTNFTISNIENGTKQFVSWINPNLQSNYTFVSRQLFYTLDNVIVLESMTRNECLNNSNVISLTNVIGSGNGNSDSYTTNFPLTIGTIIKYKIFTNCILIDNENMWSNGIYGIKEVKDETPCSDYSNIVSIPYDQLIKLTYTDPTDSDWAKTVILVCQNAYADSELYNGSNLLQTFTITIKNQHSTNALIINSLQNNIPIYISLFSFNTSDNVNRNPINRTSTTPLYISTNNPTLFTSISDVQGTFVDISWVNANANFTTRELYGSTIDISAYTRDQCVAANCLLNSGSGTGMGNVDSYTHTNLSNNTMYYYKIFTRYVYYDTIFYSTGISTSVLCIDTKPPLNLVSFSAVSKESEVDLSWVYNSSDNDILKLVLVRTENTYASSENDTSNNAVKFTINYPTTIYVDNSVINGIIYYYRAFIYDTHGNINNNTINEVSANPQWLAMYEIEYNETTDVITRRRLNIGQTASTLYNVVSPFIFKRCILNDDGTVNYYLKSTNSALKEDNTTATLDGTSGQVMVEINKFYYRILYSSGIWTYGVASTTQTGYSVHPMFIHNNITYEKVYMAAFEAYKNSTTNKFESRSLATPTSDLDVPSMLTLASARGINWTVMDKNALDGISLLNIIMFGSLNIQTSIGLGISNDTSIHNTGETVSLGNSYGNANNTNDGLHAVSICGIENLYGNIHHFITGIVVTDTSLYLADYNYSSFVSESNLGSYTSIIGYTPTISNGFVNTMQYLSLKPSVFIGKTFIGSNSTYYSDMQYSKDGTGNFAYGFLGYKYNGSTKSGLFAMQYVNSSNNSKIVNLVSYGAVGSCYGYKSTLSLINDLNMGAKNYITITPNLSIISAYKLNLTYALSNTGTRLMCYK